MLRERNETVPIPPRLPTLAEVNAAEKKLGRAFPRDFRRYLLEASDIVCGRLEPVTIINPDWNTNLFAVIEDVQFLSQPASRVVAQSPYLPL
jgi:hypothetical protein